MSLGWFRKIHAYQWKLTRSSSINRSTTQNWLRYTNEMTPVPRPDQLGPLLSGSDEASGTLMISLPAV